MSSKDQELPHDNEWEDFLAGEIQLTSLLLDYLKNDE